MWEGSVPPGGEPGLQAQPAAPTPALCPRDRTEPSGSRRDSQNYTGESEEDPVSRSSHLSWSMSDLISENDFVTRFGD